MTGQTRPARPTGFTGFLFGRQSEYVQRLKPLFALCLIGFGFSLLAGYSLGDKIPQTLLDEIVGSLPDLGEFDAMMIFLFIVFNNVVKSFVWMILGVIGSFPPLFFAVLNGFFLGHFTYNIALETSIGFTVAALVPHGIIEIPTILLSSAAGMGLGYALINRFRGRGSLRAEMGKALLLFITKIVPFLVISAVVEVTLTPIIVAVLGFI